ncbi:triple tyrosine motif-containing protein [Alloiococcus sp. CFN-8]|uniref:triple tyrosine motif-containing protein n=1 Tax=Alloiococcus sp. CFN-8 TaxID=3416081 RepID=UPI003CEC8447
MKELEVSFSVDSPQARGQDIKIEVINKKKDCLYKFSAGLEGVWTSLKDYSNETSCLWRPERDGKYTIIIQEKHKNSKRTFDNNTRVDYVIGSVEEELIKAVSIDKEELLIGEKLSVLVDTSIKPVMLKYWISGREGWELIKDYTSENELFYTVNESGKHDILIECKTIESSNNFDDFKTVSFFVSDIDKVQITDFRCLSENLLTGEELIFQVEASQADNRMILYKFIKIDPSGRAICVQDYSSKRMVTYKEEDAGDYKLLCLAKDMYSPEEYDDRGILVYNIKAYNPIKIKKFTTDLLSPQGLGTNILLKAITEGGKELLYRYKIEGPHGEDSGFIRNNSFLWMPQMDGDYKVNLYVKDKSSIDDYEAFAYLDYIIEDKPLKAVIIRDVVLSRDKGCVKEVPINVTVYAEGGNELRYSFIIYKDNLEVDRINYGTGNWMSFTPQESGEYELEIRVKDKYSLKEYDSHTYCYFKISEYVKGIIDYVLVPAKEYYMVEDKIELEAIAQNTRDTLLKYSLFIDGHKVEEWDYGHDSKFTFTPKVSGKYTIVFYSKSVHCTEEYDDKKEVKLYIHDAHPVTGTKIKAGSIAFEKNKEASFSVSSEGGREVIYEFYLMKDEEWTLVQRYSRKRYYTFIPFTTGKYKLLALSKSFYKKVSYEDYALLEFTVL